MAYEGAMEVRSLVEVFRGVAYNNDGMRPYVADTVPYGWKNLTSGANWSSNGDIGSVSFTAPSTFSAVATITSTFSTDVYSYLVARGRGVNGGSWAIGFKDLADNIYWSPWYGNSTFETKVYSLPSGHSISEYYLRGTGTFQIDYVALSSLSPLTITPINMTINRNITGELSEAELELDYEKVKDIDFLASELKIWLSKDTVATFHKVFTGIVDKVSKEIRGHTPRTVVLNASDYGQYLQRRKMKRGRIFEGYLDETISKIVADLVEDGEISIANVDTTNLHYTVRKKIQNDTSIFDLLVNLAEEQDMDFYIDFGKDLHCWKRGTRESGLNIDTTETTEFPFEEDTTSIINVQEVIGADGDSIGSDSEWTESLSNWTGSGSLSLDSNVKDTDSGGAYSIKNRNASGGTLWFARDMGTLDLSLGGVLCYSLQLRVKMPLGEGVAEKLRTKNYFIGPNGTFWVEIEAPGAVQATRSLSRYDASSYPIYEPDFLFYYYPMTKFEVPFNYKASYKLESSLSGELSWDEINTIRVEVVRPFVASYEAIGWIDNMRIEQVHYASTVESSASIAKYGRREGFPKGPDYSLDSKEKCEFMASIIVDVYKDPVRVISDVETIRNFTYEPGYEYTISVGEMTSIPVILRNIRHEVEGLDLHTYLSFSERWIPDPEKLFVTLKNQLEAYGWNIEAWKRAKLPSAAIPTRSELIEFWEASQEFAHAEWTGYRSIVGLAESKDGYSISTGYAPLNGTIEIGAGGYFYFDVSSYDVHAYLYGKKDLVTWSKDMWWAADVETRFGNVKADVFLGVGREWEQASAGFWFRSPTGGGPATVIFEAQNLTSTVEVTLGTYSNNVRRRWEFRYKSPNSFDIYRNGFYMDTAVLSMGSSTVSPLVYYGGSDSDTTKSTFIVYQMKLAEGW